MLAKEGLFIKENLNWRTMLLEYYTDEFIQRLNENTANTKIKNWTKKIKRIEKMLVKSIHLYRVNNVHYMNVHENYPEINFTITDFLNDNLRMRLNLQKDKNYLSWQTDFKTKRDFINQKHFTPQNVHFVELYILWLVSKLMDDDGKRKPNANKNDLYKGMVVDVTHLYN